MQLWGDDFEFTHAEYNYNNLSRLFKHINDNPDKFLLNIQFSTPSKYLESLANTQQFEKQTLFKEEGDFFPYADNEFGHWTGFYSTRPHLKKAIRNSGQYLV